MTRDCVTTQPLFVYSKRNDKKKIPAAINLIIRYIIHFSTQKTNAFQNEKSLNIEEFVLVKMKDAQHTGSAVFETQNAYIDRFIQLLQKIMIFSCVYPTFLLVFS